MTNFLKAVLAGMAISLGGIAYLQIGGVVGSILFAFGLLGIIQSEWLLYTGKAGFFQSKKELANLVHILLGNIVGCEIIAAIALVAIPGISAIGIIEARAMLGIGRCFLLSILCGFIMSTIVHSAKKGHYLTLLLGIPLFILCGFVHSVADAFYLLLEISRFGMDWIVYYLAIVVGNFIGCNLFRIDKIWDLISSSRNTR